MADKTGEACKVATRSRQVRSITPLVALVILFAASGRSVQADESRTDLSASYALTEGIGDQNDYRIGWLVSAGWYVVDHLGVVGEIAGGHRTIRTVPGSNLPDLHLSEYAFMGGVRIAANGDHALRPFAQFLLGGVRFANNYGSVSYFCWQPGAGVDIKAAGPMAIRIGADYRLIPTHFDTLRQFGLAIGIVFEK